MRSPHLIAQNDNNILYNAYISFVSNDSFTVDSEMNESSLVEEFVYLMSIGKEKISKEQLIRCVEILLIIMRDHGNDFDIILANFESLLKEKEELITKVENLQTQLDNAIENTANLQLKLNDLEIINQTLKRVNEELLWEANKFVSFVGFGYSYLFDKSHLMQIYYSQSLYKLGIGFGITLQLPNPVIGLGISINIPLGG